MQYDKQVPNIHTTKGPGIWILISQMRAPIQVIAIQRENLTVKDDLGDIVVEGQISRFGNCYTPFVSLNVRDRLVPKLSG